MNELITDLIDETLEQTDRGRVKWTAFDSESFRAPIGPGYFHIQRGGTKVTTDDDELIPAVTFSIQISDEQGRVVAEADVIEGNEGYSRFARLFQAARKSALKSDRVIQDMLQSLRGGPRK